jgi:hypothetical protein
MAEWHRDNGSDETYNEETCHSVQRHPHKGSTWPAEDYHPSIPSKYQIPVLFSSIVKYDSVRWL